jgi:hypothetical protein
MTSSSSASPERVIPHDEDGIVHIGNSIPGGGKVIISIDYNKHYGYRFLYAGVKRLKSSPA